MFCSFFLERGGGFFAGRWRLGWRAGGWGFVVLCWGLVVAGWRAGDWGVVYCTGLFLLPLYCTGFCAFVCWGGFVVSFSLFFMCTTFGLVGGTCGGLAQCMRYLFVLSAVLGWTPFCLLYL
jgi:hypothetical protein